MPKLLAIVKSQSLFNTHYSLNIMRRTIENIIVRLSDPVASVREMGKKSLLKIKRIGLKNMENALRRLSSEHQELFRAVLAEEEKRLQREEFVKIALEDLEGSEGK